MTDPIKQKNEVSLGGVRFNKNQVIKSGQLSSDKYYIDLQNGTRVVYDKQTPSSCFFAK